jgi:hypothetical protein
MICPNCAQPMTEWKLTGHLGVQLTVDVCTTCQAFWFERHEDLGLTPASTLQVMKYIGDHSSTPKPALPDRLMCPHCGSGLTLAHNMTRNVRFVYWQCSSQHGHYISFFDFLKEKNFIRPLSTQEIQHLRESVQEVHCSNCGGSVNLQTSSTCPFCHSPISILDLRDQQSMLAQLKEAAASDGKQVDPALPLKLAMAKAEVSDYFSVSRHSDWWADPGTTRDLVVGALKDIARLFTGRIS